MASVQKPSIQELYPADFAHCYGCGRLNAHGLHLESAWEGEEVVARFTPQPQHISVPGYRLRRPDRVAHRLPRHGDRGGLRRAPRWSSSAVVGTGAMPRYVTAALRVDYLLPTPLGPELVVRGRVRETGRRKIVVEVTVSAAGRETARGEVVAVPIPEAMVVSAS